MHKIKAESFLIFLIPIYAMDPNGADLNISISKVPSLLHRAIGIIERYQKYNITMKIDGKQSILQYILDSAID